jgi:cytoskeletal protein RodZ
MPSNIPAPPDLPSIRRSKGVSLQDIAATTRIGVNYLEAIEKGEFAKLPGGVYNTSYIRQYARAIDFDEADLLDHYYRTTGLAPQPNTNPKPPSAPGGRLAQIFRTAIV